MTIGARELLVHCLDLFQTASAKKRHWARLQKWIEKRTGHALTQAEVKALYTLSLDFDAGDALEQSSTIEGLEGLGRTETSLQVIRDNDDAVRVTSSGIRTVAELMAAAQLDPATWYAETVRPNYWESLRKDGSINPHFQIRASFSRLPPWATAEVKAKKRRRVKCSEPSSRALFVPDTQHGFRRTESGELIPMHDEAACQLAVEAARAWQPHEIFLLGDHLDLAPWGKYQKPRDIMWTTTETLQTVHDWIAQFRRACPSARIRYLAGNHESRISRAIVDNLREAEGLRAALSERPVMSIANLLALDAIDVEYCGPYGAEVVLWDCVGVSHGTKHGQRVGQLLSKRLPSSTYSWVQGHDHKMALGTRAIHERGKVRHVTGMCPGTLSRVDGAVPGVSMRPNWSQGLGFAARVGDDAHMWVAPIVNRSVVVNGQVLTA